MSAGISSKPTAFPYDIFLYLSSLLISLKLDFYIKLIKYMNLIFAMNCRLNILVE